MNYLCSKYKGADQLHSHSKKQVFSRQGSYFKPPADLLSCTSWSPACLLCGSNNVGTCNSMPVVSDLVGNS